MGQWLKLTNFCLNKWSILYINLYVSHIKRKDDTKDLDYDTIHRQLNKRSNFIIHMLWICWYWITFWLSIDSKISLKAFPIHTLVKIVATFIELWQIGFKLNSSVQTLQPIILICGRGNFRDVYQFFVNCLFP